MPKKLLVVEDQDNIIELLGAIFSESGYKIFFARDGKEALKMARGHNPDIVLLDIQLPKIDGFEVCKFIKSNPDLSRAKVLMLSSQGQQWDFQKAREVGADGYIVKPFRPVELVNKVEELLNKD